MDEVIEDGTDVLQKKESSLTIWHWFTIVLCTVMIITGIVIGKYLMSIAFLLIGYFEIKTAVMQYDIQKLQEKINQNANKDQ